mmetsp:Transcript_9706/g.13724  ORF Transcript_9706/g.13724 Transcript_9706/m.13724 type:complete len:307 (+) Transcript_9706:19-939(+)
MKPDVNFTTQPETSSKEDMEMRFDWINKRLIGPPISGINYGINHVDYNRWYAVEDVHASIKYMDEHADVILPFVNRQLETRFREAKMQCQNVGAKQSKVTLERGGWCLVPDTKKATTLLNSNYTIPLLHKLGSKRIIEELSNLIIAENITSINDFGAGVGQYKPEILQRHPNMDYEAYDGAGNVYEYTHGSVKFFDLTFPLGLPKREWVVSLEVGEHVPSMYEGMLIRNLHRHNTKGIVLSWAILGQLGHSHINNHSNKYIIELFESLGYTYQKEWSDKFRNLANNYVWFTKSVMVFKKNQWAQEQ